MPLSLLLFPVFLEVFLFSIGTACNGNFSTGNSNSETTNIVEDNRKTNVNSAENSVGNIETSNNNSTVETSNNDSAEKPDENVENPFASDGELPSEAQMQAITMETLLDFNDAVLKGDFTDFHGKISSVWKKTSTPETFNQGFKEFIEPVCN